MSKNRFQSKRGRGTGFQRSSSRRFGSAGRRGLPKKIRYAVVGLGHIAQVAVLPAFAHASRNSALAALVSDNPKKLKQLSRLYGIGLTYSYEQYDDCLQSGDIDAVYIALPNSMHA